MAASFHATPSSARRCIGWTCGCRGPFHSAVKVDGIFEVFNLFNHENQGSFTTVETSALYGRPVQNSNVAYLPRMLQLGFRVVF